MHWEKNFTKWVGSRSSVLLHTVFFLIMFLLPFFGFNLDSVLLILTTVVSLEAIYLSIFIQMTVNENTQSLEEVEEEIEEISDDIDEIQEDVGEIQQDVDEIQADVDEIQVDVDQIEKDTDNTDNVSRSDHEKLESIETTLKRLLEEVETLKRK